MTSDIKPWVNLGENCIIEDQCIIGVVPTGGLHKLVEIGHNALIRSGTIIYCGTTIGHNFVTGNKVNIRENCEIGAFVSIGTMTDIEYAVKIKNGVRIHSACFIPEFTYIEEDAWIGPCVVMANSKYPNEPDSKAQRDAPIIRKAARIGAGAVILPGVTIGEHSLVGAGAVVTKNVEPWTIVVGNPAHFLRKLDEN